jgi:hypothetical protein
VYHLSQLQSKLDNAEVTNADLAQADAAVEATK